MIRSEDVRLQKMIEAFESLKLTQEEWVKIEGYLRDEAGEETLEGVAFRDLEQSTPEARDAFQELVTSLFHKKRYAEVAKVFHVLFALGKSTAGELMQRNINPLRSKDFREKCNIEPAKLAAVCAHIIGSNTWGTTTYNLESLNDLADGNLENMLKAIDYYRSRFDNGKLLLMTVYFWKKYPNELLEQQENVGTDEKLSVMVKPEDAQLLSQYEEIIIDSIENLFVHTNGAPGKQITKEVIKRLEGAISQGKLSEQLLAQINGAAVSDFLLKLLGGAAYVNYMLSNKLKDFMTLCFAANMIETMNAIISMDARKLLDRKCSEFDVIFSVPSDKMVEWATEKGFNNYGVYGYGGYGYYVTEDIPRSILRAQFIRNRQAVLDYKKKASFEGCTRMMEVIRELDSALYKSMVNSGSEEQKRKVIQQLVRQKDHKDECIDYLLGNTEIDALYAIAGNIKAPNKYGGNDEWKALSNFHRQYNDQDFFNRVMVYMSFRELPYFFRQPMYNRNTTIQKEAVEIFEGMKNGRLDVASQLHTFVIINDSFYGENDKKELLDALKPIFLQQLQEKPEETKKAFAEAEAYSRYFGLCVMEPEADAYKAEILGFSQDTAKVVKEKLENILKSKQDWRAEVMALLSAKKAAERELAIRVMLHWNTQEDLEALRKLLETEKNAKIRNLLESVLQTEGSEAGDNTGAKVLTLDELVKNLHKGGKKRSLAWAYETPFSKVHKVTGEPAEEEYLQAILLCYAAMNAPGVSGDAKKLSECLNESEFAMYVNELFDKWLEAGAEAKKRWVMYAASIHGGSDMVKKLHHQIQEWPQMARGAIATDAVQALALSPQPQALLIVDSIARKFKFKQVKAAAGKALEFAASQLGLTREELEDKIVPNLGFDEKMERHFDYGERSFTVTITTALEIEVFGEDGKKLKNLPAPGKKDDEEKANAAYTDFKEMKKQMKTTISSQKQRLEAALSSERLWSITSWQELFVKNPVMHQFAIGLIWGIYEEHKLIQSFRYMEDGSFNTEDEDEYTLPEQGYIGLVHPIELTPESREAWKQQLEDYEIKQPIEQLSRAIYYRTEEEMKAKTLERFGGMVLNDLSLNGKMQQIGWYRGSVQDAGGFDTFYREDAGLGLGVELHFSGTFVGCMDEDVTVYDARFYKAGTIERGSYMYDEADEQKQIPLKQIPERYFSEIVLQLTKATSSSKEIDEDWKKNK